MHDRCVVRDQAGSWRCMPMPPCLEFLDSSLSGSRMNSHIDDVVPIHDSSSSHTPSIPAMSLSCDSLRRLALQRLNGNIPRSPLTGYSLMSLRPRTQRLIGAIAWSRVDRARRCPLAHRVSTKGPACGDMGGPPHHRVPCASRRQAEVRLTQARSVSRSVWWEPSKAGIIGLRRPSRWLHTERVIDSWLGRSSRPAVAYPNTNFSVSRIVCGVAVAQFEGCQVVAQTAHVNSTRGPVVTDSTSRCSPHFGHRGSMKRLLFVP
jgi:hypothetical protein